MNISKLKKLNQLRFCFSNQDIDSAKLVYTGAGLGALALTYYATKKDHQIDPLYNFDQQSIEIDV
jgi:hypothetical protein